MTDKQKLQQLFDAALKSPTDFTAGPPKRAFPTSSVPDAEPVRVAPAPAACTETVEPSSPAVVNGSDTAVQPEAPTMAGAFDAAAATELGTLLDEQLRRKSRKRKLEVLVTVAVLLGLTGGASAWFVQSPERVQACKETLRGIRSVDDVKSMVGKYQDTLNRISARSDAPR